MNRPTAMPAASASAASPEMASSEFESCVERFEAAWVSGREPRIGDYLVSSDYPRRVKPSNLLLDQRRDVSLTDFGLARSIAAAARGRDEISGTLGYMAPEQFGLGGAGVGPATDVYGLGATLYTLLTGRTPVAGSSLIEVVKQHIAPRLPAAPRAVRPEIPVELEAICLRCLAADPRERFAAMDDVASCIPSQLCSYP